jgi:hypothetical protein
MKFPTGYLPRISEFRDFKGAEHHSSYLYTYESGIGNSGESRIPM